MHDDDDGDDDDGDVGTSPVLHVQVTGPKSILIPFPKDTLNINMT